MTFVFSPNELEEHVNLYDFIALFFDVKHISKWNESDMVTFVDDHSQFTFRGVINQINEITPLVVSYFPIWQISKAIFLTLLCTNICHQTIYEECAVFICAILQ
jgi:hypothetical protein